jgi:hypothetical protein
VRSAPACRGARRFGEYFVYFSFLVIAALLLAGLFFRLGLEAPARGRYCAP